MLASIFGSVCSIDLSIAPGPQNKHAALSKEPTAERVPIFSDGDDVWGTAQLHLRPHKKLEHNGVKVELIGLIELFNDRSDVYEFFSMTKDLEPPGLLMESRQFEWRFNSIDKPHETYWGNNIRLRYFVRLIVVRTYASNIVKEADLVVQNLGFPPEVNQTIRMEVGIEDCVHIEFEYDKSKYHLKDVIVGKVYFVLVRIRIKHMELDIIRSETAGTGSNAITEMETVSKFEIMDGSPVRSECIPVRFYLAGSPLGPTCRNVQNKFSVKYHVNLVLVDDADRRYYKKQEITLWRKRIG